MEFPFGNTHIFIYLLMSVSDKEITKVGFSSVDNGWDDDGDDKDDEHGGVHDVDDEHGGVHSYRKKKIGGKFSRNLRKAKKVIQRPFTSSKKEIEIPTKIQTRDSSSSLSASDSAPNIVNFPVKRTWVDGDGVKGCYFCFRQPLTSESSIGSPVSDPDDPNFSYDMLKVLIETNDFYSKDCNPHLDIDRSHWED